MIEFLQKLFPFIELVKIITNQGVGSKVFLGALVSSVFVLILLIIFFRYIYKVFNIRKKLHDDLVVVEKKASADTFIKTIYLKRQWKLYQDTFSEYGETFKTIYPADHFMKPEILFRNITNTRLLGIAPSVLIGIGILGTFIGLTIGIANIDTTDVQRLQNSVEILLSGMGAAFVTSIWGMALSVLLNYTEKKALHGIYQRIDNLCDRLDGANKVTRKDEIEHEIKIQKQLYDENFTFIDSEMNKVNLGSVLRDIYHENTKQSKALQSFSSDLAEVIEAGFERILSEQFDNKMIPALESLKDEIGKLAENLRDPATEMTQSVIEDLRKAMESMLTEFRSSISESAKNEFDQLSLLLSKATESLNDIPEKMNSISDKIDSTIASLQTTMEESSKNMLSQTEQSVDGMKNMISNASQALNTSISELQLFQEVLLEKQKSNIEASEKLLKHFSVSLEKLNDVNNQMTEISSVYDDVIDNINNTSNSLKGTAEDVVVGTKRFIDKINEMEGNHNTILEKNSSLVLQLNELSKSNQESLEEFIEKFEIIEDGIGGVFEKINSGLVEYMDTIEGNTGRILDKYTDALNGNVNSLVSLHEGTNELVNELNDGISKIKLVVNDGRETE